jgi:U2 small nuclear ribonucleoprotein B''
VSNIDEKINKHILKQLLYMLFSQYGRVIEVIACKGTKLRGQAWVVFKEPTAAASALRGKQGFNFYGKPLKIAFSRNISKIIEHQELGAAANAPSVGSKIGGGGTTSSTKRQRETEYDNNDSKDYSEKKRSTENSASYSSLIPNKILAAQNLPSNITQDMLKMLFQNCSGLAEVRMVHPETCLIIFGDEIQSSLALRQLQGFQLNASDTLKLSYASI